MSIQTISVLHGAVDQVAHLESVTFNGKWNGSGAYHDEGRRYRPGFDYALGSAPPFTNEGPTYVVDGSFGWSGSPYSYPMNSPSDQQDYEWIVGNGYSGYTTVSKLAADKTHIMRARGSLERYNGTNWEFLTTHTGGSLTFKTNAVDLTFSGGPSTSGITQTTATLSQNYFPNTDESTATGLFQYRIVGASLWTETAGQNQTGYLVKTRSVAVTGLVCGTTYEYRLRVTRTTNNGTDNFGTIGTLTTGSCAPTIQTDPATGVGHTTATLNGTLDANALNVRVRFGWQITAEPASPGVAANWANLTGYQEFPGGEVQTFGSPLTGLVASTTYFFRAFIEWPSPGYASGDSGASLSVTTTADPGVLARQARSPRQEKYAAHYGVLRTFYFSLDVPADTNSDRFVNSASPVLVADVKISKDGSAPGATTNNVARVDGQVFSLALTATEMQATDIVVMIVDTTGTDFRDLHLQIETKFRWGQLDVDANLIGSSNSAILAKASPGGYSLEGIAPSSTTMPLVKGYLESMIARAGIAQAGGVASITLDAGADVGVDYYKGAVVLISEGPGAGQARTITSYSALRVATVNRNWSTQPTSASTFVLFGGIEMWDVSYAQIVGVAADTQLSAIPGAAGLAGGKLQMLFQRHAFVRDRTATTLRYIKNDGTTQLAAGSVSYDGQTEIIARLVS